jgi:predicted DCC family thiol-disulfide oxidoreductase YuxK
MDKSALLIYDGDCAFCKNSLKWAIDHLSNLPRYAAFQNIDLNEYSLSLAEAQAKVWLIQTDKQFGGHHAVAWLFSSQRELRWRLFGGLVTITSPISGWTA